MQNDFDYTEFRKSLNTLYDTPQGRIVFQTLEQCYVDTNVFNQDTNTTMYNLGKKELIQSLLSDAKTKYVEIQQPTEE
jgi:hypothetical protein